MRPISHEKMQQFVDQVKAIKEGQDYEYNLEDYFPREIARAIQDLIEKAVKREGRNCASIVDSAAEPSGVVERGQKFEPN